MFHRLPASSVVVVALFAIAAGEPADRKGLPAPQRTGGAALADVLSARRSTREFGQRDLDDRELGQLLWAAQGENDGHRTAPSAGALYPLTVRVADARGVWRYAPRDHAITHDVAGDRRDALAIASFSQQTVRNAPAVLVITADFSIPARKYGRRGERFATLEAGHVAQNVLLEATALGLGAVTIGAFDEDAVRRTLALPSAETPLYLIPVGPLP